MLLLCAILCVAGSNGATGTHVQCIPVEEDTNCILAYIIGTQAFHVTTIEGSIVMDRSFHCDVAQLK